MCGDDFMDFLKMGINPLAPLQEENSPFGGKSDDGLSSDTIKGLAEREKEKKKQKDQAATEAKEKQLEMSRRSRRSTILTSLATNSSGQKTLLGQ